MKKYNFFLFKKKNLKIKEFKLKHLKFLKFKIISLYFTKVTKRTTLRETKKRYCDRSMRDRVFLSIYAHLRKLCSTMML